MKFLILNSFHRDDKGDAALLHVLIDQLLSIDPKAEVSISSMENPSEYPTFYKGRNVGSFELHSSSHMHKTPMHLFFKVYIFLTLFIVGITGGMFSWLFTKELKKIYTCCRDADLVVSVGGGYFITKRDLGSRMHLLFALQALLFCKRLGRKVVTAPVSVGPFQKPFEAKYAARILKKLDLLLLREDISKKYFLDKNGVLPENVKRAPDSAFSFSPEGEYDIKPVINADSKNRILMLAVRNWMTWDKQMVYEQAHADLIDYIAEKYPDIKPVFIPQCTFKYADDDDDRIVARRIIKTSKTKKAFIIENDLDYQKVKLSYKDADFVVGTRFHSMVFGLSYSIPGIAIEYEHKTRGIMRDLGLEKWVTSIDEVNTKILLEMFENLLKEKDSYKIYLSDKIAKYIELADRTPELFRTIIKK